MSHLRSTDRGGRRSSKSVNEFRLEVGVEENYPLANREPSHIRNMDVVTNGAGDRRMSRRPIQVTSDSDTQKAMRGRGERRKNRGASHKDRNTICWRRADD